GAGPAGAFSAVTTCAPPTRGTTPRPRASTEELTNRETPGEGLVTSGLGIVMSYLVTSQFVLDKFRLTVAARRLAPLSNGSYALLDARTSLLLAASSSDFASFALVRRSANPRTQKSACYRS